jgi:hypothetical protein
LTIRLLLNTMALEWYIIFLYSVTIRFCAYKLVDRWALCCGHIGLS